MIDPKTISVLCDAAGVAGFALAAFQTLSNRTNFRVSDVDIHLVGHSGAFMHACVSMTVTNNSSRGLALEALYLSMSGSGAFPPLTAIQAKALLRRIPDQDAESIDLVEAADVLPVLVPAHSVLRISLLYRLRTRELLEPAFRLYLVSASKPCSDRTESLDIPVLDEYLDLHFVVRGRTVHRKIAPGRISFSAFEGMHQAD